VWLRAARAASLVASAATPGVGTTAGRRLLAEVHVIIDGRIHGVRIQTHFIASQQISIPRLDTQSPATTHVQGNAKDETQE
jgi:hypothetical protein